MPRVLIVSYGLLPGGSELHAKKLISLINGDFSWLSLVNHSTPPLSFNGLENKVEVLPGIGLEKVASLLFFGAIFRLFKLCREKKIEFIYAIGFVPSLLASCIRIFNSKVTLISTRRELMPWKRFYHLPAIYFSSWASDRLETNSSFILKELEKGRLTRGKGYYLPNIVQDHVYNPKQPYSLPEELFSRKYVVGTVANLREPKNPVLLRDTLVSLLREREDVNVLVAGIDRSGLIRTAIDEERLEGRLFLLEDIDYSVIGHAYKSLDVFIITSKFEGSPNTVLEAMANGLPIVATRITATEEIINDKHDGLLVTEHESTALSSVISKLLDDEPHRKALVLAAREKFAREFGQDTAVERLRNIFKNKPST